MGSEAPFRKKVVEAFRENDYGWPIENSAVPGMSDILGVKGDAFFFVETKFCEGLFDKVKFQAFQPNWIKNQVDKGFEVWIAIKIGKGHHATYALMEGKDVHWCENKQAKEVLDNPKAYVTNDFQKLCKLMLK